MANNRLPVLAITVGDVAGIGPEIIVKALAKPELRNLFRPLVIGDRAIMEDALRFAPKEGDIRFSEPADPNDPSQASRPGTVPLLQPYLTLAGILPGRLSEEAGRGAVAYVEAAIGLAKRSLVDGIVTAPLNKAAMRAGGYSYPGHTELLAEGFGTRNYSLVLAARGTFVFHVTTHVSLRDAIAAITVERVFAQIRLAHLLTKALGREREVVAVAGINPHAGEGGIFGDEEIQVIGPAIEQARMIGIPVEGPLPADVLFPRMARGQYGFCVAMYHDQGHAIFKSLYFDEGVNLTVGLPVIRTSVDHGTAFDIAGKGIAKSDSMVEAIRLAAVLGPLWADISKEANLIV